MANRTLVQTLPKEIQQELGHYVDYNRISFWVKSETTQTKYVDLLGITFHGFVKVRSGYITATWEQLREFVAGGDRLGKFSFYKPTDKVEGHAVITRRDGITTLHQRWNDGSYHNTIELSPEAEELFVRKLTTVLKDYGDPSSVLYTSGYEWITY